MQADQEDRIQAQQSTKSSNTMALWGLIAVIAIAAGGYFYFSPKEQVVNIEPIATPVIPEPVEVLEVEPVATTPAEQPNPVDIVIPTPTEPAPVVEALPSLENSDELIEQKAQSLTQATAIAPLLVTQDMARQFVVFVDNLAQGQLARNQAPFNGPKEHFSASDITDKIYLNPDSYQRYDLYANALSQLDEQQLLATYQQLSPILDQAFAELGYQDISFNGRLEEAIDELLAAPIIETPIELTSVSVNYKFADPKLEALPAAQKLMIRMGPENAAKVKQALRQLKQALKQAQ
ncbi:DUF3014 domain-containing protein [Shewanella sp. NIFS-20-20]|uniref:DUF3014 domain-containing protein n=1 Tax=Shewanella sp. NIFS-20-20 TaxID=2853806 RepID=UPI001C4682FA|nr:DUF3014 domain-containing protein [Shewanella sp. NIFS-20-20]MBV7315621.1 DUF3014 domain-containing protein [Shewanella sp. NIFS-20-20]